MRSQSDIDTNIEVLLQIMRSQSDIDTNIEVLLKQAEPLLTDEYCIFNVLFSIRRHNPKAYRPNTVSIGPFHHNCHPHLIKMEKYKRMRCNIFLEKTQTSKERWIRYIEEAEPKIRRCYSDILEFTKEQLVNIIFVDSGFILDLFTTTGEHSILEVEGFHLKPWLVEFIRLDLMLLENQLPFFVLDDIFNLSGYSKSDKSFIELTFHYFGYYNKSKLNSSNISIRHFTDLIRTFYLPHPPERRPPRTRSSELVEHFPTVTELSEAGVSFKVKTIKNCLLDLDFSEWVLEIPSLEVIDSTEFLLSNMIALELCLYTKEQYITDYVIFWDLLINTSNDVDLLVRKGILVNWLGDTDCVAKLFNGLLQDITEYSSNSHYFRVCQDLNAFYKNSWNNLKSTFKRDYCKTPWQTVATIAGLILLILSFIQTVCSILQVIQQ